jgi:hypothetical protein
VRQKGMAARGAKGAPHRKADNLYRGVRKILVQKVDRSQLKVFDSASFTLGGRQSY